ncbi:MAG: efflux RND transporter periplasmic adaptor subunit, partial [Rhodobacteraceae bacterium]
RGIASAEAAVQAAQAAVAAAETEIGRLSITAPFAGLLESDTAELGSLMQPGSLCATVIQLDPIKLVAFVAETEVDRVEPGAPAGARLVSGREVRGRVSFLSRSADETTRTFRVEIEVANPDFSIRDGQTAEILIAAAGQRAHLLPQSALTLNNDGRLGVRVVGADSLVEFLPVTLLRDTPDGVWITDLPDAADVIVVGQDFVAEGVRVEATYRETSE